MNDLLKLKTIYLKKASCFLKQIFLHIQVTGNVHFVHSFTKKSRTSFKLDKNTDLMYFFTFSHVPHFT
jgi:hypothetical protein